MEEFEVDKAYESGIELHKCQHHPEIHVTWHLHIHKNMQYWRGRVEGEGEREWHTAVPSGYTGKE